jgi:hypothetical protein
MLPCGHDADLIADRMNDFAGSLVRPGRRRQRRLSDEVDCDDTEQD